MAEPGGARVGSRCPTASHSHSIFLSSTYLLNPSLTSRFASARFHAGNLPFFFRLSISLCPIAICVFTPIHNPFCISHSFSYTHRRQPSPCLTLDTFPIFLPCDRIQKYPCLILIHALFSEIYRTPQKHFLVCGDSHSL